jgi:hypothetical protein
MAHNIFEQLQEQTEKLAESVTHLCQIIEARKTQEETCQKEHSQN